MSADITSQEDLDDAAFRALLEPLASEVLPGRSPPPQVGGRSGQGPRKAADLPGHQSLVAAGPANPEATGLAGPSSANSPRAEVAPETAAVVTEGEPGCKPISEANPGPLAKVPGNAAGLTLKGELPPHSPSTHREMLPEGGSLPRAGMPSDATPALPEVRPDDWTPLTQTPPHQNVPASPEGWWAPPPDPLAPPDQAASEQQGGDGFRSSRGQIASFASGVFSEARWRLAVAAPDVSDGQQPPHASAPALGTPSPVNRTFPAPQQRAYRSRSNALPEGATRATVGPRLIARAGAAREAAVRPVGATRLVMQRPVLPPAHVRWRVVVLAGLVSAVTVAGLSWLFTSSSPVATPGQTRAAVHADAGNTAPTVVSNLASVARSVLTLATMSASRPGSSPPQTPRAPQMPAQGGTPAQSAASQSMIGLLTQRGDAALAVGDIIAARLLYERAATMGSATAATAAGKTYDLDFLVRADTHGIRPDPAAAATWYRKAVALGDPSARTLLARLGMQSRP